MVEDPQDGRLLSPDLRGAGRILVVQVFATGIALGYSGTGRCSTRTDMIRREGPEGLTPLGEQVVGSVAAARAGGLGGGARTYVLRGRMDERLVAEAKRRTGIASDTALIEAALAHLALTDDYPAKLARLRGSVPPDVDLEF